MIVQINGEDHQFDRAALGVLQHLKVIHLPAEAARQDYEPTADLVFGLARAPGPEARHTKTHNGTLLPGTIGSQYSI